MTTSSSESHVNPIGHRLRLEMRKRTITSAELAKRADVKTSFLYDIMSGKSANPSTLKLARVAAALEVSLAYLVGSGGPAEASDPPSDRITPSYIGVDPSPDGGNIIVETPHEEGLSFRRSWIRDELKADPASMRLLRIRGDSMEPALRHNDLVMIDISKTIPSPPGVFVIFDGFGLSAKRLEYMTVKQSRKIRIMCDNPQYSTYERPPESLHVVGRVLWFARQI